MPDVTALPRSGDIFAGKYLIEGVIGRGKASLVFDARHRMTGRRFAIEWLVPDADPTRHDAVIDDDEDTSDRAAAVGGAGEDEASVAEGDEVWDAEDLVNEARDFDESEHRVIGHFQHPNVLEVYDVGEASGSLYTVMNWAEGESLEARIQRAGPMSVHEACRLLIPCMRGMHEAHAAGILHRDLKPSNIFICRATRSSPEIVKLLDFEVLGSPSSDKAVSLALHGKQANRVPYYCAPEQLGGLEIDHRVDVYAFGAILYEVLSGRPPFAPMRYVGGNSQVAARSRVLSARGKTLSPGADQIVARAMARDVSKRFQTLSELANALEAHCAPRPSARILPPRLDAEPRQFKQPNSVYGSVKRPFSGEWGYSTWLPLVTFQRRASRTSWLHRVTEGQGVFMAGGALAMVAFFGLIAGQCWTASDSEYAYSYDTAPNSQGVVQVGASFSPPVAPPTPESSVTVLPVRPAEGVISALARGSDPSSFLPPEQQRSAARGGRSLSLEAAAPADSLRPTRPNRPHAGVQFAAEQRRPSQSKAAPAPPLRSPPRGRQQQGKGAPAARMPQLESIEPPAAPAADALPMKLM